MIKDNIILIGMSGAGKSTLGVLLAKALGKDFADTDLYIQQKEKRLLQEIIDAEGIEYFMQVEEDVVSNLAFENTVIATGGSVIYGNDAMKHLHNKGIVVYIRLPYSVIERRLSNLATRGVTLRDGQTLLDLYNERIPLYEASADVICDASGYEIEKTVSRITELVNAYVEVHHGS